MASSTRCPATRAWPGRAALRLAETQGPRGAGARPPVTAGGGLCTG
jgi:hypothetical protein